MAVDVELFIFAPAQLASQKSEFFEEVYFRCRVCNGGVQFGFKHGGRVIVPVFLEFAVFTPRWPPSWQKKSLQITYEIRKVTVNSQLPTYAPDTKKSH